MVCRVDAYPVPMCSVPKTKQNKQTTFTPTHLFTSLSSMEDPKEEEEPQMLKSSPEFEFCMVRNPHLLFADELIADGVLVPLDLVSQVTPTLDPEPRSPPLDSSSCAASSTSSKRWTDIFKISDKKTCTTTTTIVEVEEVKKKKERKSVSGSNISAAAELNINIWPFSRSWSGGNNRSKTVGCGSRKVSSAPCSRSNSAGESKSRIKPNSPRPGGGAGGIHLGRNSPVWQQVRRKESVAAAESRKNKSKSSSSSSDTGGNGTSKGRGLNLSVPMCMGYRQQLSCRREDNILVESGAAAAAEGNKLFYFRTLFTKKVH